MKKLNEIGAEFVAHSGLRCTDVRVSLQRTSEELQEAFEAAADPDALVTEMADVVLTLASIAASFNLDLDAAVWNKHQTNLARQWAPHPTLPGCVKHVKKGSK